MKRKNLSNYFNNWHHIKVVRITAEQESWCKTTFGYKGLTWNISVQWMQVGTPASHLFMFKREDQAVLFLLKFGGVLIQHDS